MANHKVTGKKLQALRVLLCLVLLVFYLVPGSIAVSASNDLKNNYDSLLVIPSDRLQRAKRMENIMYRTGIVSYRKVKDNLYVIPISISEDKNAKVQNLINSGLFKLVEPDYKLGLDEVSRERNYIKINHVNNNQIDGANNEVVNSANESSSEVTPNDSDFLSQYYLRQINVPKAWNTTKGSSLVVGILDTGVDINHPDLEGKLLGNINLSPGDTSDNIGHGTEVAGIIAANTNNRQGIAGISWNTKILPIRITDEYGQAKVSTVVEALDRAYNAGVKIVQISLSTGQFSQVLKDTIQEANERGILVISTSGNTGSREIRYPAAFEGVIGVGAVDSNKTIETYSTQGEHVSIVAPGSLIYTTSLYSEYSSVTGTSFAAPQVAGTAALIWSVAPNISNKEVRNILLESTEDLGEAGKDFVYGSGLLNTEAAVKLAKERYGSNHLQIETNLFVN